MNMSSRALTGHEVDLLISGGGITGIVSALYAHSQGLKPVICESSKAIGGILKDWLVDGDWYFRNCQYISPSSDWFKLLPRRYLMTFPHAYGSYTDLWGHSFAFRGYAGPVYSCHRPLSALKEGPVTSLYDRLNLYPEPVSSVLLKWVKRFAVNPQLIHSSGVFGLQISRIFPFHFADETYAIKSENRNADQLYGLPRHYFGLDPDLAALPVAGYTELFKEIEKQLGSKSIAITFSSPTSADHLKTYNSSSLIRHYKPYVVWTGSPVPLLRAQGHVLDSVNFKMRNIVVRWRDYKFDDPYYIQVYSMQSSITRIFVYMNKATIECFCDGTNMNDILLSGLKILELFYDGISMPEEFCELLERRHFLLSVNDYLLTDNLFNSLDYPWLIPSPWHVYSRDEKIRSVFRMIDKYCLGRL